MKTGDGVDEAVRRHPFLEGFAPMFFDALCDCVSIHRFTSQQQIFQEGGEADYFYLIVSGEVALETFVPGWGMVTIQILGAGDALGWSSLFPPHDWQFTATTREPTEVISLNAARLRRIAEADHEFDCELLTRAAKTLYQRLLGTRKHLVELYGMRR